MPKWSYFKNKEVECEKDQKVYLSIRPSCFVNLGAQISKISLWSFRSSIKPPCSLVSIDEEE